MCVWFSVLRVFCVFDIFCLRLERNSQGAVHGLVAMGVRHQDAAAEGRRLGGGFLLEGVIQSWMRSE